MPATPWVAAEDDDLTFWKELLPVGPLTRWVSDDKEVQHIDISLPFLERIKKQFAKFQEGGVSVPLFKTHVEDPDNDRGKVRELLIKKNEKGFDSLFAKIRFNDAAARDQGINNDVSVLCPPTFVDGKNRRYNYPLRHVALTSKPVVPGLEPFQPIVLSFDTPSGLMLAEGDPNPDSGDSAVDPEKWAELLGLLDITPAEDSTEDQQLDQVISAVKELQGDDVEEEEEEAAVALSYPPVMVKEMIRSRKTQLDSMVKERDLTPVASKKLEGIYCTKEAVIADLKLSEDSDGETEFDRALDLARMMAKDRPLAREGRRTVALSHGDEKKDSPLVANAKKRAEAAAKKK